VALQFRKQPAGQHQGVVDEIRGSGDIVLMAVKRNLLTLKRVIEITGQNPARIFSLKKGALAPGYDADMMMIGEAKEIRKEKMHSKAGWTPFHGMKGIFPKMTVSRGEVVFEDGEIIGRRGRGKFISGQGFFDRSDEGKV